MAYLLALGALALFGFILMLRNYIERPDNDSGYTGGLNARQSAEFHPSWPPENERLSHQMLKWWEW